MEEEKRKQTQSSDKTIEKQVFCSCKGAVSLLLIAVGIGGHFVALPFVDLTLIACNASSAILLNMFISWKYLGETFKAKYDLSAVFMVTLGTLIILLLSNKDQQTFDVKDLNRLFIAP